MLGTAEIRILRRVVEMTIRDQIRSDEIRIKCKVERINEWIVNRKRERNNQTTGIA